MSQDQNLYLHDPVPRYPANSLVKVESSKQIEFLNQLLCLIEMVLRHLVLLWIRQIVEFFSANFLYPLSKRN